MYFGQGICFIAIFFGLATSAAAVFDHFSNADFGYELDAALGGVIFSTLAFFASQFIKRIGQILLKINKN
jgi:hypothetical protein